MLKVKNMGEAVVGLADKAFGLALEAGGTIMDNERLKEAGRKRQDAGSDRLTAFEEEVKAAGRMGEREAQERRQRAFQPADARSSGVVTEPSAPRAAAETAKGTVKQIAGKISGSDDLEEEGRAQREKGSAEGQAAKHEAKAEARRTKADAEKNASERLRRA